MFYRAKNNLKRGMRIKLGLTKSGYDLLNSANSHVKEVLSITFFYTCINFCRKIKFNDENQKEIFFCPFPFYDLRDITDMEIYPCLSICLFLFFLFSCCFVFCHLLVSEKNYLKHELIKVFTTLSDTEDLVFQRCEKK